MITVKSKKDYKIETKKSNKENVKALEEYFHWCLKQEKHNNKCFTVGVEMIGGDLLEMNYIPADANQFSDDNRIEIDLNGENISITQFRLNEDYIKVQSYVLENLDTVLIIEDGIKKAKFAEAIRKAAIEVINEHPDMDLLPEDLKLPKIKCDGLGKYTRKERK